MAGFNYALHEWEVLESTYSIRDMCYVTKVARFKGGTNPKDTVDADIRTIYGPIKYRSGQIAKFPKLS